MNTDSKFLKSTIIVAVATILLLLIPLLAMQFSSGVDWSLFDFIVAGFLLFGTGLTYVLLTTKVKNGTYKAGIAFGLFAGLFLIWANLAVGIIGSEDNPVNIIYYGVIGIGILGAVISRFKSRGLSLTMFVIALILLLITAIVLIYAWTQSADFRTNELMAYIGVHGLFIFLFSISGVLFRQAAQDEDGLKKFPDSR
ncbi:MAG: hypothetical protein J5I57_07485 [Melioribacteraceae bacterium]|nr:hypothetical protein [Melioribacteraceae bacterium]